MFTLIFQVVILGGGFAGCKLAQLLEKDYECVLVDKKTYFECQPSLPTLVTNPSHAPNIRASFEKVLKKTQLIVAGVSELNESKITLDNGTVITEFDHCIIATGSYYDISRIKTTEASVKVINCTAANDIINAYATVLDAKSIVVIGSGPVAVEIAGEIMYAIPQKKLTVVSMHGSYLERCCKAAHTNITNFFNKYPNVKSIFNEKVEAVIGNKVLLSSGKSVEADVVFCATGFTANTAFMEKSWSQVLNKNQFVKVNKYLQVEGYNNLWAIGDVTSIREEKLAQNVSHYCSLFTCF